ncbi:hypothetical protein MAH1_30250 [Sessilibacter sp. MAH1]
MKVKLKRITKDKEDIIISLFNCYIYEFSAMLNSNLPTNGRYFKHKHLIEPYWSESDHIPYFIEVNNEIAGFVFIRKFPEDNERYDIDQFFVLKRYSRQGIGRSAFNLCVQLYPGKWLIRVLKENKRALEFWQNSINAITNGQFNHSYKLDFETEMHFFRFTVNT